MANDKLKHIVRVANTDLKGDKQIVYALTKIKGVGNNFANFVCCAANINKQKKAGALNDSEVEMLNKVIADPISHGAPTWLLNRQKDYDTGEDKHLILGKLTFQQETDVKRMMKTKSYRGLRHHWKLPLRGQRTRSNFRKSKGKGLGVQRKKKGGKK
ncbi:30S ribosomal protein S13 [Candidatus Woesearchaeota archaeon]|nr:MAG: 30S ribosomal protein S13 [Candidatus Woesearchaeota archaeon]